MKLIIFLNAGILVIFSAAHSFGQQGHFKIRNDGAIQIGYSRYNHLTFGNDAPSNPNNGKWSIEYWQGGLHFWKPWPTANAGSYFLFIKDDGKVGIGNSGSSMHRLSVTGTMVCNGYWTASDARLKKDIQSLDKSKEKLLALKGVSYKYSKALPKYADTMDVSALPEIKKNTIQADRDSETETSGQIGFIAQDLVKFFPDLVKEEDNGYLSINYSGLIPVLVEALKEQQNEIDFLKTELATVKLDKSAKSISGLNATLSQNFPNPFTESTVINYSIESPFETAQIIVYNFNGEIKKRFNSLKQGAGSVTVEGGTLIPGTYHYSLIINGTPVDSKTTILLSK